MISVIEKTFQRIYQNELVRYLVDLFTPVIGILMILTLPNETSIDVFQRIFWLGAMIILVTLSHWNQAKRQEKERKDMDGFISLFLFALSALLIWPYLL